MENKTNADLPLTGKEILIIEDDALLQKRLAAFLKKQGAITKEAGTLEEARNILKTLDFDFSLLDIHLPDGNGLELFREKLFSSACGVIVITADGGIRSAVEAMKFGASDYLMKPFDFSELPLLLERSSVFIQQTRIQEHQRKKETRANREFFFGKGLKELQIQLQKIVETDALLKQHLPPVLISGETGTGKSSIARWIHYFGPRSAEPFIEINCSTLTKELAESELFGHERGSFTDAKERRIGLFEAASKGTLFLDEISSLAPAIQSKILTAIEDRKIRRVGGTREYPIDTRIIAASLHDLKKLVADGFFREDLYHRLDLLRIFIPPLRLRLGDLPDLAEHLLINLRSRYGKVNTSISPLGVKRLSSHSWPGNVRELAHEIERALILEEDGPLHFKTFVPVGPQEGGIVQTQSEDWLNSSWTFPESGIYLEDVIQRFIHLALGQTQNNVSAAARKLHVPRDYLRYRLKK